jgi:hypothetical protein
MGFPQLQAELRMYPHRRRRTYAESKESISQLNLTYMRFRNCLGVFRWHSALHILGVCLDIAMG